MLIKVILTRFTLVGTVFMEKMKIIFMVSFLAFCPLSLSIPILETSTNTDAEIEISSDIENRIFALFDEVKEITAIQNDLERNQKIREIIDGYFAKDSITKIVIGKNWRRMSDVQKKEFIDVFSDYMIFAFIPSIEIFFVDGQIQIKRIDKRRKINSFYDSYSVRIKYSTTKGRDYDVLIGMLRPKKKAQDFYKIYNVTVDGINFFINFRTSFSSLIRRKGFKGLINDLKAKIKANQEIRKSKNI